TGDGIADAVRDADRVIHLAAAVKARTAAGYHAVNRDGTARLAGALAALPRPPRLVVCSSLAAAGPSMPPRTRRGSTPPQPVSWYGASKRAGEEAVREYADRVEAVILRPAVVYGPGDAALLPPLLRMVRLGLAFAPGPRRCSMVYVDDLCTALLSACEKGTPLCPRNPDVGIYPISDGREYGWPDLYGAVAEALGRRPPILIPAPAFAVRTVATLAELLTRTHGTVPALNRDKAREMRCVAWTCSPTAATRDLDFTPTMSLPNGFAASLTHPD
ncbi:MAG TPA: NAD(P)-dependent oxidoreductase, partial [Thermomonospora sp.]|nr:NAD(P)-dependent oxidoreductase [Thermomonospora sp.]